MGSKYKKEVYKTNHSNVERTLLMKENQQITLRLLLNNEFRSTDPELTDLVLGLYQDCPLVFENLLPRSEIKSLNEEYSDDAVDLVDDVDHVQPRAVGRLTSKCIRSKLGFPVLVKEFDTAFSMNFTEVYSRDYSSPDVLQFGKNPLQ